MDLKCVFRVKDLIYTCLIETAEIIESKTEVRDVIGAHHVGKSNLDVHIVYFKNTTVYQFPRGLQKIFPNMEHLSISSCGLQSISREDLKGLGDILESAYFDYNELTSLPDDLFEDMQMLKEISFEGNELVSVKSTLLKPILELLIFVDFCDNVNIDAFYGPGSDLTKEDLMKLIDRQCKGFFEVESASILQTNTQESQRKFVNGFAELWKMGNLSDFTIITKTKQFRVHKTVLAIQCTVIAAYFETEGHQNEKKINEYDEATIEQFLNFLYTGELPKVYRVDELFKIASKFGAARLKSICEDLLLKKLNEASAFEIFMLGHQNESVKLKVAAFDEIQKNFLNETLDDELMNDPDHLRALIQGDKVRKRSIEVANFYFQLYPCSTLQKSFNLFIFISDLRKYFSARMTFHAYGIPRLRN